ncbi:unnamed protein product [Cuscuta europaea]|uniref:Uncharacterized protein n=1 Tax=Cuscuta europaea TaxID=41803 RepID=A0A9P0ZRI6_CUSEU|nr:unnamed protein product [Cuscuta europaea]
MQTSSSLIGIPIKKRRFPFVLPSSPPSEEPSSCHDESDAKKRQSGSIPRSSFNPVDAINSASKSDSKNPLVEGKQERLADVKEDGTSTKLTKRPSGTKATEADDVFVQPSEEPSGLSPIEANASSAQLMDGSSGSKPVHTKNSSVQYTEKHSASRPSEMEFTSDQSTIDGSKSFLSSKVTCRFQSSQENITSAQSNAESSGSKLQVSNAKACLGHADNVDNGVKADIAENSIGVVENTNVGVKMETTIKQDDCHKKIQPSVHPGSAKLSIGRSQRQILSLGLQDIGGSELSGSLDPSLLSLSLNKEKATTQMRNSNSGSSNVSRDTDRSNWDLNTTMDTWEGSGEGFQEKDNICNMGKSSLSPYGMDGACNDKGKQVCGSPEQICHFSATCIQSSLPYKSGDSLCLSLGSTFRGLDLSRAQFCSMSSKADSISHSNAPPRTIMNLNAVGCGNVKEEPIDNSSRSDYPGSSNSTAKILNSSNSLKLKLIEEGNVEPIEFDIQKVIEKKSIKSEPMQEPNQETCGRTSSMELHQSAGNVVPSKECSTFCVPLTPEKPFTTKLPSFSELSVSGELSNQSEHSVHTKEVNICKNALDQINAGMVTKNEHSALEELNAPCSKAELVNVDSSKTSYLKQANEQSHSLAASGEGSLSGEQDMNISADVEEESYGYDYESDGHHHAFITNEEGRPSGKEDDDYEDGEVREPVLESNSEKPIVEGSDTEKVVESHSRPMGALGDDNVVQSGVAGKDETITYHQMRTITNCMEDCGGITVSEKIVDQLSERDGSASISISENVPEKWFHDAMPANDDTHQMHFDKGADNRQGVDSIEGVLCDVSLNGSNETGVTVSKISVDEDAIGTDEGEKLNSCLVNPETPLNGNDTKDCCAVKSRIINLPRASHSTSPSKSRPVISIPLSSRSGRGRYFDVQDGNFHPSGNRGEMYGDGSNKYTRDRFRERTYERSNQVSFMRGRGRGSGRFGRSRRDWDSDRHFSYNNNNNRMDDYSFGSRHKQRASAIDDANVERNDFDISPPDGAVLGPSSRGRKLLNSGSPSFRHSSSRRLSPVDRGIQRHGTRIPRNNSPPSRCTDEDSSEMVGHGHGERFDMIDSSYNRRDGQFTRGKKMFPTSIQRRGGYSRVRSKSPDESSQRHSPSAPWCSSRRRAMEGLDESPVIYHRVDRMRSPAECDYFSEDMAPRRRNSPSYAGPRSTNNMRDVDAMQERSPNHHLFARNARRHEGMNRRERVDSDDYYCGPVNSSRKYSDRRGISRSFRPPYNNNNDENENFRFHPGDDGPRSFRCSSDEDSEFLERNSTREREREFDGRMKNGTRIAHSRRMRNAEEQEGNYRPNAPQVWHDDGMKRRRF